jgi:hypothetical protein
VVQFLATVDDLCYHVCQGQTTLAVRPSSAGLLMMASSQITSNIIPQWNYPVLSSSRVQYQFTLQTNRRPTCQLWFLVSSLSVPSTSATQCRKIAVPYKVHSPSTRLWWCPTQRTKLIWCRECQNFRPFLSVHWLRCLLPPSSAPKISASAHY